jgi:hypothetical protein
MVLKCYNFRWVQWWHNCSPAASFTNWVMSLCLLKVHLQMFLSISVTHKCQILSCDTFAANEQYVFRSQWFKGSPLPLRYILSFLITLFNGAVNFQDYMPSVEWYRQWGQICPIVAFSITNPTRNGLSFNLVHCDEKMATNHLSPYILYCISLYIIHVCLECRLFLDCIVDAVLEEALSEML